MEVLVEKWKHHPTNSKPIHFYIRNVPEDLHGSWKSLANFMSVNMREVALEAIEAYVAAMELQMKELRDQIKLGPSATATKEKT